MNGALESSPQRRIWRELRLLDLRRRLADHGTLTKGSFMAVGRGRSASCEPIGWRGLLRRQSAARRFHGRLKARRAEDHGGLCVGQQFAGYVEFLFGAHPTTSFQALTVFKLLDACEMFGDHSIQLLAPPQGGLQLLPQMVAFGGQPLRHLPAFVAVQQRSLQALAKIVILQLKALDPGLQRRLFQTLPIEALA